MKDLKIKSLYKPSLLWKEFTQHTFKQFYASLSEYYRFLKDLQSTDTWKDIAKATANSLSREYNEGKSFCLLYGSKLDSGDDVRIPRVARMFCGAYDACQQIPVSTRDPRWWEYEVRGPEHPAFCTCDLCDYACWVGFRYTATRFTKLTRSSGLVFDALTLSRPDWLQYALVWQWCYNFCSIHNGLDCWASRAFYGGGNYAVLNAVLRNANNGFDNFVRENLAKREPFTYLDLSAEQTEHLLYRCPMQASRPCPYNPIGKETLKVRNEDEVEVPF